jgi:hypothetical protein
MNTGQFEPRFVGQIMTAKNLQNFEPGGDWTMTKNNLPVVGRNLYGKCRRERLKKNCGHAERGFLSFGEALAKEQV